MTEYEITFRPVCDYCGIVPGDDDRVFAGLTTNQQNVTRMRVCCSTCYGELFGQDSLEARLEEHEHTP